MRNVVVWTLAVVILAGVSFFLLHTPREVSADFVTAFAEFDFETLVATSGSPLREVFDDITRSQMEQLQAYFAREGYTNKAVVTRVDILRMELKEAIVEAKVVRREMLNGVERRFEHTYRLLLHRQPVVWKVVGFEEVSVNTI